MAGSQLQCESSQCNVKVQLIVVCESSRPKQTNNCQKVLQGSLSKGREAKRNHSRRKQKNNTRDSNVVPHRSTNLARHCLTSLSRREAVLSMWYGRSQLKSQRLQLYTHPLYQKMPKKTHANPAQASKHYQADSQTKSQTKSQMKAIRAQAVRLQPASWLVDCCMQVKLASRKLAHHEISQRRADLPNSPLLVNNSTLLGNGSTSCYQQYIYQRRGDLPTEGITNRGCPPLVNRFTSKGH